MGLRFAGCVHTAYFSERIGAMEMPQRRKVGCWFNKKASHISPGERKLNTYRPDKSAVSTRTTAMILFVESGGG